MLAICVCEGKDCVVYFLQNLDCSSVECVCYVVQGSELIEYCWNLFFVVMLGHGFCLLFVFPVFGFVIVFLQLIFSHFSLFLFFNFEI